MPPFCSRIKHLFFSLFYIVSPIGLNEYVIVATYFFNLNLFILIGCELLYNIVLVLPHINMNPPRAYTCSPYWTPPPPPPSPYHPSGTSQCTSPKHPVLNLDWQFIFYMILYMFPWHSPKYPTLSLSHRVQKTVLYICVSFAVIVTIFLNSIYMH